MLYYDVMHVLLLIFMYIIMHSNFLIKLGLLYILSLYIVALNLLQYTLLVYLKISRSKHNVIHSLGTVVVFL
jgi:hypothetical protein